MKITKPISMMFLGISLIVPAVCSAETQKPPSKVLLAQAVTPRSTDRIAQVKAGTIKTANASWWGFDKEDSTKYLQDAINSGVPELIVDNVGGDWVIGEPIQLVSNQKVILRDVTIQAKKGAFKGKRDSLINGDKVSNVQIIGEGKSTVRMQRADYDNRKLYEKAEWRHGINLMECKNIVIRGFTVAETGGDGLYLGSNGRGYNQNILVENMNFDANYRQGLSVISADGLVVRNSKFNNTKGTAPQAGIDFEPNHASQRITNCIIENSEFIGNEGSGVEIALMRSDHTTEPISVTVKNSYFKGNGRAFAVNPAGKETKEPVRGKVLFEGNALIGERVTLSNPVEGAIEYLFKDTTFDFTYQNDPEAADWQTPVSIGSSNPAGGRAIGNVQFENVTVVGNVEYPVSLPYTGKATIADSIGGSINIKNDGKAQPYDVVGFVKNKQVEFQKFNRLVPAKLELEKLKIPANSKPREGNDLFYLRGEFTFLQYAKAGETLKIDVGSRRVYPRKATIQLIDPRGKEIGIYDIPARSGSFSIEFTAQETGFYQLVRRGESSNYTDINSPYPGSGFTTFKDEVQFLPKSGYLYFEVPAGVKEFTIGVAGSPEADVALVNPQGKEVERLPKLGSLHLFSAERADGSKSEIWSLHVRSAVWAVNVKPYAPLSSIVSTNPTTMLLRK